MLKYILFIPFFVFAQSFPLTTCDRFIVDNQGFRVKLASVNWYGAHEKKFVVGGLDVKPLNEIARLIKNSGFNSVRLTFSNEMLEEKKVDPKFLKANPELIGKTPLQIFDLTVEALARENIIIVLNNHTSAAGWCCLYEEDGLWYTRKYSERKWINDWEFMAKRYAHIPQVAAVDLRNEIRIAKWRGTFIPNPPQWGTGKKNDWRRAAQLAGNGVLRINPDLLIVVEGINFPRYHLRGVWEDPIQLIRPSQLVYSVHNYSFTKPKMITGPTYGEMSWDQFKGIMDEEWGFVLNLDISKRAPVWLSEFGESPTAENKNWFGNIIRYLTETDSDFAYWPLNAGFTFEGNPEGFSILNSDWSALLNDWRIPLLKSIQRPLTDWSKYGYCKNPPYKVLSFDEGDAYEDHNLFDWSKGDFKGTCGKKSRVVGVSFGGKKKGPAKAILCSKEGLNLETGEFEIVKVGDKKYNNLRTHLDWSLGFDKIECARNSYVKGIAQSGWHIKGILCTEALQDLGNKCKERIFDREDDRGFMGPSDWQSGFSKGQCGLNEYLAGLSTKKGVPHSILCCQ
jgi:endoglucanase